MAGSKRKTSSVKQRARKERSLIIDPVEPRVVHYPGRAAHEIARKAPPDDCIFRYFMFTRMGLDANWTNLEIEVAALVRGGILKIDLWAVEKVVWTDPETNEQTTSHEAIIVDGAWIGDSLQPNCAEEIRHLFRIPLANLWGRKFRVQAVMEDCCNDRRGIMTSPYFIV